MNEYTLVLSFDMEQVTESLRYAFWKNGTENYPQNILGRTAGTFNFDIGDQVSILVVGTQEGKGAAHPEFEVQDCSLVFVKAPQVFPLSLFDPNDAVARVSAWSKPEPFTWPEPVVGYTATSVRSANKFTVNSKTGQWKMSGYLSVKLGNLTKMFFFDPESSAGGGAGLGAGGGGGIN